MTGVSRERLRAAGGISGRGRPGAARGGKGQQGAAGGGRGRHGATGGGKGRQGVARDGRRVAFEFLYQKYGFSAFILPVDIAMSLSAYLYTHILFYPVTHRLEFVEKQYP